MPIFEYRCRKCGSEFEEIESYADRDRPHECPCCGAKNSERKLSVFVCGGSGGSSRSCGSSGPKPT
jgi:putative FmdB family regulatory protein